jgi:biotin transport system substrate-specific component
MNESSRGRRSRPAAAAALFAALTAVAAFVRIPLPAVPLTLQTAVVLLSGILLGPRYGAMSQVVYIIIGLMGAPVFAQGGGPGYVLNPTFGYLFGFVGGAAAAGALVGDWRKAGTVRLLLSMTAGLAVIYLSGLAYLYWNINFFQGKDVSFVFIVKSGFLVFVPGDAVKIALLLPAISILKRRGVTLGV